MKKYIFIILASIFFSGCVTLDYYTNPASSGYRTQALGGLCEVCGREFVISGYQLDNDLNVSCPYDGHAQNTMQSRNRWIYAAQQQQAIQTQQAWQNIRQTQRRHNENKLKIYQDYINRPRRSSMLNTRQTNCKPDGLGGYRCTSY